MPKPYQPPPVDWQTYPMLRATTVAKLLDVDPDTVRRMIADGRLQATKLGRKGRDQYRVLTASLIEAITHNLVQRG